MLVQNQQTVYGSYGVLLVLSGRVLRIRRQHVRTCPSSSHPIAVDHRGNKVLLYIFLGLRRDFFYV